MKNIKTSLLAVITLVASTGAYAAGPGESRVVEKARLAVESADSFNWLVLARSAEKCFQKNENIDEALTWIDKSIEINADPMNLEIKGDYFRENGHSKEAVEQYYKAIVIGKRQSHAFDSGKLQEKIWGAMGDASAFERKGDYYEAIGTSHKAVECYYKAIVARKSMNFTAETSDLQMKILKLR